MKKLSIYLIWVLLLGNLSVSKAKAEPANNAKPIPIQLGYNQGTTFSWADSSEVIQQMWLDNPTFATIDIFGCVTGWKGCTESNAQIIHLKRNKDLKLKHIPYANSTLLTIVTKDKDNRTHLHFYEIKKHDRSSHTLVVAAKAPAPIVRRRAAEPVSQFGMSSLRLAEEIDTAIAKARRHQPVNYKLVGKLNQFANLLKLGTKEPHALALSGVSPELVREILKANQQ